MPALFHKRGLQFQYPENWRLDETGFETAEPTVSVESPGGAFWSVTLQPAQVDPHTASDAVREVMEGEYDKVESYPVREPVGEFELEGYDLHFFYLDFINTAWIRSARFVGGTLLIHCQGEDREFERLEAVFRAITASLLMNLPGGGGLRGQTAAW